MSQRRSISAREAAKSFGISTSYEIMPNGEFRSRMTPEDGNGYIRTVASPVGAWQKAHCHRSLKETYIVESGWIASAQRGNFGLDIQMHLPGAIFTTEPNVGHNIYMSAHSVIHTVKHQGDELNDWHLDEELTSITSQLSEADLARAGAPRAIPERYSSYIDVYNNLDKLLWSVPNLLGLGGAVVIGFFGSILSREPRPDIHPIVFCSVFLFASLLFFLGYASISRLREHHTLVGNYLAEMEGAGYFKHRQRNVARRWPPSAPLFFRAAYLGLSAFLFGVAVAVLVRPSLIDWVLSH